MKYKDDMIEGLVEESVNFDVAVEETTKDISDKVVDTIMGGLMVGKSFNLPEGYQFKDENGNVINATKIVLEKKKKEYPKTYRECCKILEIDNSAYLTSNKEGYWNDYELSLNNLIELFRKLLICRDAYWKIAGDWKPEYPFNTARYVIANSRGFVGKVLVYDAVKNYILEFPTEEMRDAFYENFKELIESVKELL
jgi:hypothetical protein